MAPDGNAHGLWVPSHTNIGGHPKTRKLARRLDISIPEAVGHLHLLWHWALTYAEDGELSKHDPEDVAIGAHFEGNPGDFLDALAAAGFVDQTEAGKVLHDWNDFAGRYLRARAQRRQAALTRWHGADRMRPHSDRNATNPANDATAMQSREENSREDKTARDPRRDDRDNLEAWLSSQTTKDGEPLHPLAIQHAVRRVDQKHFAKPKAAALTIARDEHPRFAAEQVAADRARAEAERVRSCDRCNDKGQIEIEREDGTFEGIEPCDHGDLTEDRSCEGCGASLSNKRRHARFCSERCRKRVARKSKSPEAT